MSQTTDNTRQEALADGYDALAAYATTLASALQEINGTLAMYGSADTDAAKAARLNEALGYLAEATGPYLRMGQAAMADALAAFYEAE
jgi:hypothetical protein